MKRVYYLVAAIDTAKLNGMVAKATCDKNRAAVKDAADKNRAALNLSVEMNRAMVNDVVDNNFAAMHAANEEFAAPMDQQVEEHERLEEFILLNRVRPADPSHPNGDGNPNADEPTIAVQIRTSQQAAG